jgi:hypothetical protein
MAIHILNLLENLGITGLIAILLGWLGKRYLDRKLEIEKSEHQANIKSIESSLNRYLEIHKQKIKNSEIFFQIQYEASQKLYEIKVKMRPPYSHPDMDWHEALEEMSNELAKTASNLQEFLNEYFTVLCPKIVENLESAIGMAEEGQFVGGDKNGVQFTENVYNRIKECSSLLKAEVDGQRQVEFREFAQKT